MRDMNDKTEQQVIDEMFENECARLALIRQKLLDPSRYTKEDMLSDIKYLLEFVF